MKIQLDTENKVIKVQEAVNLGELTETLERLLPNGKWKDFKLDTQTQINWTPNPIIIKEYPYQPYIPIPWWEQPWIICGTDSINVKGEATNYSLKSGVFNIEA
jgi:hypothetical protein